MIRSFGGQTPRYQIELCDEIGLLVYQEHAAAWRMEPSPQLPDRFRRSVQAMVKRDRNHPSVVIWGMLNETHKGPIYDQALAGLPYVRELERYTCRPAQQWRLRRNPEKPSPIQS